MADSGFIDVGSTQHFSFEFDKTLDNAAAQVLGKALLATCERDYNTVASWFDGLTPGGVPFSVQIGPVRTDRGGSNDQVSRITVDLGATTDFSSARQVVVAEMIEIFMPAQGGGHWKAGQSHGEGLSQAAGFEIYPDQAPTQVGVEDWLGARDAEGFRRQDFVSRTDNTDRNPFSYGCALLFIYYLRSQLGFSMRAIVQAAADTLEGAFTNLTTDHNGFAPFSGILITRFPLDVASGLNGSTNPFPLPSSGVLSCRRFFARHPDGGPSFRQRVTSKNIGNLRALLNSDRPASLIS
jgi:hypothetical protein